MQKARFAKCVRFHFDGKIGIIMIIVMVIPKVCSLSLSLRIRWDEMAMSANPRTQQKSQNIVLFVFFSLYSPFI